MFSFQISKKFKEDIEPQEILLDYLAKKKEEELGIGEKKLETPLSRNILKGFLIFVLISISFLFIKTFQFQVIEGKKLSLLADQNKFKIYQIRAERGVIYDKNGEQLVYNQPSFDLVLNVKELPENKEEKLKILKEVATILKQDFEILQKEIENSESPQILIFKNLQDISLILLEAKISSGELPGFQIERNFIRKYSPGFSHLIGYTGKISAQELEDFPEEYSIFDWVGRSGIESSYEKILRRNPGRMKVERDALGNLISQEIIQMPEVGKSLILQLDGPLQIKIKEVLEKQLQTFKGKGAAAVALDPQTGGVLALVSLPDFDSNLFQKDSDSQALQKILKDKRTPLFNRAISGKYLVGSIVKPLIASAVLEEKIISLQKKINCQGKIVIPNPWDPSSPTIKKDWTTHGPTDLRKAIAESCNVYFYTIGGGFGDQEGLGLAGIKKYLQLFGWEEKTGIDLPEESPGFIPDKEWKKKTFGRNWVDGDTYNLSIGQGFILITPLEVAIAFSAIANGGKLLKPQVVKSIVDKEKNVIQNFEPQVIRENFINPQTLQFVREGMRWAVTGQNSPRASAQSLNFLSVSAAAKTGTAELGNDKYHNWITVFAPYENPQIVLTILIEEVETMQVPVLQAAKEILEWYFKPVE